MNVLLHVKTRMVTADLLAQAEHETDSRLVRVITSRTI
jgi:histidinol dehydrogenase